MSVHNGAARLRESMDSILAQKEADFELVVVNDGSTDEATPILRGYAASDPRIRLVEQGNTGLTVALARGCAIARGRYIARQDAGDLSLSGRLVAQKAALDEDEEVSFVSCWTEFIGPGGEFLFLEKGTGKAREGTRILCRENESATIDGPTHHGSVMFRKRAYQEAGGYRREFYFAQDWDLWYRLAEVGKFRMIPRTLYQAAVRPGSISGNYRDAQGRFAALARAALLQRLHGQSEKGVLRETATIRSQVESEDPSPHSEAAWLYFIGECLRRNGDPRAWFYLWKSARKNPLELRSWIRLAQLIGKRARSVQAVR
jgi:glycosyltransferase involved in cell wall biosynthesis